MALRFATAPELLKPKECAELLRIDPRLVYAALNDERIPGIRVGGNTWRIPKAGLMRALGMTPENEEVPAAVTAGTSETVAPRQAQEGNADVAHRTSPLG